MRDRLVKSERWTSIFKKYSVWALIAIFVESLIECALPFFDKVIPIWIYAPLTGLLAVAGIALRNWAQEHNSVRPRRGDRPKPE